ncbi:hypothetical protein GCM10009549_51920 [Streptomyces thermoalcalitolerans]|uniref:Uncharacterized protein n=1 Tax=Streptomyces thermoalcalitolerans TaxID=65605 RepID=A0ABN1PJH6_9ACTN
MLGAGNDGAKGGAKKEGTPKASLATLSNRAVDTCSPITASWCVVQ